MRFKWGNEESRYFSKPIQTAERYSDWGWWLVMAVCVLTIIWVGFKLYQLYQIHVWVSSI